jgi:hypothetical protein
VTFAVPAAQGIMTELDLSQLRVLANGGEKHKRSADLQLLSLHFSYKAGSAI